MARSSEVIRQWEILREIDGARTGVAIAKLAALQRVHQRTIRRDLEALQKAGFALYDDKVNGTSMWKLRGKPFRGLEQTGLGVTELCALYFGRSMLTTLAGGPFGEDIERALGKIERALPAACRKYLDAMPLVLKAKAAGRKKQDERKVRELSERIADAALTHRRVDMRYSSLKSGRVKDYLVEPLRLSYADGGVYCTAFVPEYNETRTFALERIKTLGVTDEHFDPRALPPEPFANSLGVHTGSPERIEIEFDASVAPFVKEREWHKSQQLVDRGDGSVLMTLLVCNDAPLRSWILGFGAQARVVSPVALAREIGQEQASGAARYGRAQLLESVKAKKPSEKVEGIFRLKTEATR